MNRIAGAAFVVALVSLTASDVLAEGLPWESLTNPGEELRRVSEILRRNRPTRERLGELAQIANGSSEPLARGVAEFGTAMLLAREGLVQEAAAHYLSEAVSGAALGAYGLHRAGALLLERNPALAREVLTRTIEEHPDYVHRDEVQLALGRLLVKQGRREDALALLKAVSENDASELRSEATLEAAETLIALGRSGEAVPLLEALYYGRPGVRLSGDAGRKLAALAPKRTPREAYELALKRADGLYDAERYREALASYTAVLQKYAKLADVERLTLRQGVCQYELRQTVIAGKTLARLSGAEAVYYRALLARRLGKRDSYRSLMNQALKLAPERPGPRSLGEGGPFAEQALLSLARHHLIEDEMAEALGYYERLATEFPTGPYADEARWRVLWSLYRQGKYQDAASAFEKAARERPGSPEHARFLFWAARSLEKASGTGEADALYRQVVLGYKNSYYGQQAQLHLVLLSPGSVIDGPRDGVDLSAAIRVARQERLARIGQLLVLGLNDEAELEAELGVSGHEDDAAFRAVFAWLQFQQGRYGLAISAMRRAFPFHVAATGDLLPDDVWRILYPLKYWELLERYSRAQGVNPFLVAAVIRQESTFQAGVRSSAGANGLMQIMPYTGRALARAERKTFKRNLLYDPDTNIRWGTSYLKQMIDRFGGRVDYALAGYNAGPHRVVKWTGMNLMLDSEEFIEEIPFSETRDYVKAVLRNEAVYRRLYANAPASQ